MPANAVRGIGRWANEFALALCRHKPDMVAAISVDPVLPLPRAAFQVPLSIPVITSSTPPPDGPGPVVFHALSVLEDLSLERVWPLWARAASVGLVATLYDMIPALYPGQHFRGPLQRLLTSRYELIKRAGAVVTISATTGADASRLLDISPDRIFNAYGSVAPNFVEARRGRAHAFASVPARLGLRPDFLLSIGNVDARKNLLRLLRAYATLPPTLRRAHQLVLTCSQDEGAVAAALADTASRLGVGSDVVIATMIDDATMTALYQSCQAMVFPSLYEGLGLPLLEALHCGAVTVCSDVGSMREIVRDPEARFDPTDVRSIGAVLRRSLEDHRFINRRRAAAASERRPFTWEAAGDAAAAAYRRATA